MDWDDIRYFSAFVTAGSLSAAAKELGVEHATVARRIAALETRLGLALVDRRGRRWTLTEDGRRVSGIADRMADESQALMRLAEGRRDRIAGDIVISAPPSFAARVLVGPLAELSRANPDLRIHLYGEARTVSLERREADIAVRLNRPEKGEFKAVKVREEPFRFVGRKDYVEATPPGAWRFIGGGGGLLGAAQHRLIDAVAQQRNVSVRSDQIDIQLAFALSGAGIALLPDFLTEGNPELTSVDPGPAPTLREVWLLYHVDMAGSAPVRAVVDALKVACQRGASRES